MRRRLWHSTLISVLAVTASVGAMTLFSLVTLHRIVEDQWLREMNSLLEVLQPEFEAVSSGEALLTSGSGAVREISGMTLFWLPRESGSYGRAAAEEAWIEGRSSGALWDSLISARELYAAVRVGETGVLLLSRPGGDFWKFLRDPFWEILGLATALLFFSVLYGVINTSLLKTPLAELRTAAELYAAGDFSRTVYVDRPVEVKDLSAAMNRMAGSLVNRLTIIKNQRDELEAILGSMSEALVVLDQELKIKEWNPAAVQLSILAGSRSLGQRYSGPNWTGLSLIEVFPHEQLREFALHVRDEEEEIFSTELEVGGGSDSGSSSGVGEAPVVIQVHGTRYKSRKTDNPSRSRILLVLNDITRVKKLEMMRKEFVGNVSHELKTPVTAIRGAAETLASGAMEDPGTAVRFLNVVINQSRRLNALIEDLLQISRLESSGAQIPDLETVPLELLFDQVRALTSEAVSESDMVLEAEIPEELTGEINSRLMEQVLTNLIDNALKYSGGQRILIRAWKADPGIGISVEDDGRGIPGDKLDRIFERFYRVDKGRSRSMGGTGLGLSIVKHIVSIHGGTVEAMASQTGGLKFLIRLPNA